MDSAQELIISMSYSLKHFRVHIPLDKYDTGTALYVIFSASTLFIIQMPLYDLKSSCMRLAVKCSAVRKV